MILVGVGTGTCCSLARANKQTDQTTTLCVQEVEIYLERWEVLGALVDVSVGRRKVTFSFLLSYTNINKGAQHYPTQRYHYTFTTYVN